LLLNGVHQGCWFHGCLQQERESPANGVGKKNQGHGRLLRSGILHVGDNTNDLKIGILRRLGEALEGFHLDRLADWVLIACACENTPWKRDLRASFLLRDERNSPDAAVFAGLGAALDPNDKIERAVGVGIATVLTGQGSATRHFNSPNDVHIQYFRWDCVENCVNPPYTFRNDVSSTSL
jgi:hypothetical protein